MSQLERVDRFAKTGSPPSAAEIFAVSESGFDALLERVLAYQRANNAVYARFSEASTFLPVQAFKHGPVTCFPAPDAQCVFRSSGTTEAERAAHYVRDLVLYDESVVRGFRAALGPGPFWFVFNLPSYAPESSLVHMAKHLQAVVGVPGGGQFVEGHAGLQRALNEAQGSVVLLGAAFGLLDILEDGTLTLPAGSLLIETGGMKTRRRAITREALHARLAVGFGVARHDIWSEYGMCELLSQCYARGTEPFRTPPWMRASVRDPENPEFEMPDGVPGALALIDLANVHTASALLTQDRAVTRGGGFDVLGRLTGAELRGCNHLMERQ